LEPGSRDAQHSQHSGVARTHAAYSIKRLSVPTALLLRSGPAYGLADAGHFQALLMVAKLGMPTSDRRRPMPGTIHLTSFHTALYLMLVAVSAAPSSAMLLAQRAA
jgi:hypothetical protein